MKHMLKYMFGFILFIGMLGAVNSFLSVDATDIVVSEAAPQTGILTGENNGFALDIPDDILIPGTNASSVTWQNRIPQTRLQPCFYPHESYMVRHTGRDFHKNYALIETGQKSLLPYLDPSLEYVFLLRRILI